MVRPRSAKPLFASSNLASTSKIKSTAYAVLFILEKSRTDRFEPSKCNSPVDCCLPPAGWRQHLDYHSEWNENANESPAEFLQVIEDLELRCSLKEKVYFAGGCIYCLRNDKVVKDYDLFLKHLNFYLSFLVLNSLTNL